MSAPRIPVFVMAMPEVSPKKFAIADSEAKKYKKFEMTAGSGVWCVYIERPKRERTLPQNSYYWVAVVSILGDELGYTKDEMHDEYKILFNSEKREPRKIELPNGETVTVELKPKVKSTTRLSTVEFIDYVKTCRRWAATEYGVYIPDPIKAGFNGYC